MRRTADAVGRGLLAAVRRGVGYRIPERATWLREEGIALILSVIVIGVLTIATGAIVTVVMSNEHAFGRDRQVNRALNLAEAGLNAGVDALKVLPATATSLPPASGTNDHGTWSYTATRAQDTTNPDLYIWTITSTGVSPDSQVTRIISTKVSETITHHSTTTTTTTPTSPAYLYGFFLGDPASDCVTLGGGNSFAGNGILNISVFVRGSLCVQGNGGMREPAGSSGTLSLYVGKKFSYSGTSPTIGTSAAKIGVATVVGGCIDKSNHAVTCSSSANSHIYANTYGSTQADVPKPTIDPSWYTNARPGPTTGCNDDPTHPGNPAYQSTYPSGYTAATFKSALFDNNSTRDTSLGNVDLLGFGSFDCRYYDSSGNLVGRLKWTTGNPGTLKISGTVFIDGNLNEPQGYAVYQGRGTIYVNGTVTFSGQASICATPSSGSPCLGNYTPSTDLLELVAVNAGNASPAFALTGQQTFEGVAFMNGSFYEGGLASIHGAVIADTANVAGNGSVPGGIDPPPGAPGAASTTTSSSSGPDTAAFDPVPGSWQQLK
jgi:Tfp pilus assembly protein PilX